jgi:phospho-N-acetylmuramoyl-pentapeptide-transferase
MIIADVVKVVLPAIISFSVGIAITPLITHYLYKYKAWKKHPGKTALDGKEAVEFNKIHKYTTESRAPRMGGIVIWGSAITTIVGLSIIANIFDIASISKLDFLSRDQTWIPLVTLIIGALVGFINDLMDIRGEGNGLSLRRRILVILLMSLFIGWWFWAKLDINSVGIPFSEPVEIGWLIIPFFMLISLAIYASGVIDGIDGLSGGVFSSVFASYTIIAFAQNQINLAAFSATLVGAILAFLWFNIPPARFYMTETGTMGLTLTIAVLAFMTDTLGEGIGIAALPIIAALLVATVASNIIQVAYKKFYGKKLFRIAPLHHHFEAIGWPGYKVTMRYWVLSVIFASAGVIMALVAA